MKGFKKKKKKKKRFEMAYFYLARYQQGTKSGWARAEILTELHFERYAVIYGRCIFLVFSLFSFFLFFFFAVGKKHM